LVASLEVKHLPRVEHSMAMAVSCNQLMDDHTEKQKR
jgi:hypothetical protein